MKLLPPPCKLTIVLILLLPFCQRLQAQAIEIGNEPTGVVAQKIESLKPDKKGVLLTLPLDLPEFKRGVYLGGGLGSNFRWPRLANQMTPWYVKDNDMTTLFDEPFAKNPCKTIGKGAQSQGMFALFRLSSGEYLTVLTLSKDSTMSWLDTSKNGDVNLVLGNYGNGVESGTVPMLVWGKDPDMYRSLQMAWKLAIENLDGSTDWRMAKKYPEAFEYLRLVFMGALQKEN